MKWVNECGMRSYVLEEGDINFSANLKRNETNTLAMLCSEPRTRRFSGNKVRKLTKPRFKLYVGDLEGCLYFKTLKGAKEFAEETFKWMTELERTY